MKKKVLIGAVAALFLGAGVFTATSLAAKEQISDLTLANIEAMAFPIEVGTMQGECKEPFDNICIQIGSGSVNGVLVVTDF